jgi:hypothetical protein
LSPQPPPIIWQFEYSVHIFRGPWLSWLNCKQRGNFSAAVTSTLWWLVEFHPSLVLWACPLLFVILCRVASLLMNYWGPVGHVTHCTKMLDLGDFNILWFLRKSKHYVNHSPFQYEIPIPKSINFDSKYWSVTYFEACFHSLNIEKVNISH